MLKTPRLGIRSQLRPPLPQFLRNGLKLILAKKHNGQTISHGPLRRNLKQHPKHIQHKVDTKLFFVVGDCCFVEWAHALSEEAVEDGVRDALMVELYEVL
jgi:hypothetical protein